ncbi:CoA-transferase [Klebsiella pneumoniae]
MAGLDKRVASYEAALEGLTDGMTLLAGGFGLCGIPENLIAEVQRRQVQGLTVVSNNCGVDGFGLGMLLESRQVSKVVEVEEIVPPGELPPSAIHTPGIYVDRLIVGQFEKRIEQRTLRAGGH